MQGDFPVSRLVALMVRQASAPIAARIKRHARAHPWFQRHVVAVAGRAYRRAELRLRLWALALRPPAHPPRISDEVALDYGANLFGEIIVFTLGSCSVLYEVNRQANIQEAKVLSRESQWVAVLLQLEELQREVVLQQEHIDRLLRHLQQLQHLKPDT